MTKYLTVLLVVAGSLAFSCQSPSSENKTSGEPDRDQQQDPVQELTFLPQRVVKQSQDCSGEICGKVNVQSFIAEGQPTKLRDSLNRYLANFLLRLQLTNNPNADLTPTPNAAQAVADTFLQQHNTFVKGDPSAGPRAGWFLTVATVVLYQTPTLVSLQIKTEGYSGGAHGYAMTTLQSFDNTGHALRLTEMVTDTVQFRKLMEQEFRKVRKLGDESFEKQGFYTQNGHLPFPQNAALTKEGLLLYYNAYEVNDFAFGATEIQLPYAQLKGLLKPQYLPNHVQ